MDKTIDDFWLMVWSQRANRIVMVTKLLESFRVGILMIKMLWYDVTLAGALMSVIHAHLLIGFKFYLSRKFY